MCIRDSSHEERPGQQKYARGGAAAARLGQPEAFPHHQAQIVSAAAQQVTLVRIDHATQPHPPPTARLTHMSKAPFAPFAAPTVQPPSFVCLLYTSPSPRDS